MGYQYSHFGRVTSYPWIFSCTGVGAPNPELIQGQLYELVESSQQHCHQPPSQMGKLRCREAHAGLRGRTGAQTQAVFLQMYSLSPAYPLPRPCELSSNSLVLPFPVRPPPLDGSSLGQGLLLLVLSPMPGTGTGTWEALKYLLNEQLPYSQNQRH